ncbi:MAG: ATP-dependent nuclease subunit B [Ruminococcaceae bacterium]|nr:ATP-dependent nuclease subunit B [Oscillospiraceae bacterium]
MLSIWVGRAGSGKSNKILQTIAERRADRDQVLIVPEHTTHLAELDLCRTCGATASRNAEVLSFSNLATRVLSQTGGLTDVTLDNGGKLLTMRLALQEADQLKVYHKPSQRVAFLKQLVDLAEEFHAYEVSPEQVYERVADVPGAAGDKLRSVAQILSIYDRKLHGEGRDARSRLEKLRDHLGQSSYLKGKDVYLEGFSYFNQLEETILTEILRQANHVTVSLLGEKNNKDLFVNALRQRERLVRMAREVGRECDVTYFTGTDSSALGHLERYFFGTDEIWQEETDQIALYEAGTALSEAEYVAAQILKLVRSGKYRYRDIVVTSRNMADYGPILESVFRKAQIPVYQDERRDILEKPILTMLLGAVDAVTGGFEYEDVFRSLKTGLAGITAEECDLLENYVILWGIRGTMWVRDKDWIANPDGYGVDLNDSRKEKLAEINRIRHKVTERFSELHDGLKNSDTAREKAEILYRFAERAGVPETLYEQAKELMGRGMVQQADETRQLWEIFCNVLDQFVEILGDRSIDGVEFAKLLRLVLTQYSVGTIPATLDQVRVSEITRNDRHQVKCLFLLGANDHVLPMMENRAGILDEADRELLFQKEIRLSNATFDRLDDELQNIYAALAQPTDYLHISYPVGDQSGSVLRPSFVVERIARLFPQVIRGRETGEHVGQIRQLALEAAGECPGGALWQYFSGQQEQNVLQTMEKARKMRRGKLSPSAVRALYGEKIHMSASRMNQLKSCHFAYFMQYGLRAKERKPAGFEAPEIGTFIHYLLENVTRDVEARGGYGAVERETLRKLVDHYVKRYAEEEIDGYGEKSARFRYLFSRLRNTAFRIVENIAGELAESDFKPIAFELGFGGREELPAITIHEEDTVLSVNGKVDRVDGWLKDGKLYLRVVDYKTGKKAFDLTELRYGLGIQMLLYLFALSREGESYFGYPVEPAGVLYMPARNVLLRADRGTTQEQLQNMLRREMQRSGMVLADPEVLRAMEHSALEAPCYLPMKVNKSGGITGSLASAAQLGMLGKYVEKLLHEIAGEIRQGNINADPCSRNLQQSVCDYCDFASACYFQDHRGDDRMRVLRKVEQEQFWDFIKDQVGEEGHHE